MAQNEAADRDASPRDEAARAAWLYYIEGLRQDQIAEALGISRQRAQRLVARALSEGLVRVRVDHPIAACLDLERRLRGRFGLESARVAPALSETADPLRAIAPFAAAELERLFSAAEPALVAIGTGRTLRAAIENMHCVDGRHHRLVSINGNVSPDGSASLYEVIMRIADKTGARHYPMAAPVIARTPEEYDQYRALPHVRSARALAAAADLAIVGIGQMSEDAPLLIDGFISGAEREDLQAAGAAGEISGYVFDGAGRYLDHPVNRKMIGMQVPANRNPVLCIAGGPRKVTALRAALAGRLIRRLITDERTAAHLLDAG